MQPSIIISVIVLFSFSITVIHAIGFDKLEQIEQQKYSSWYIGKNILPQDYLYQICDYSIKSTLNYATPCYQVQLDFIALLQEQDEKYWIVQAIFTNDKNKNWFSILHISKDFATVTSDGASMNYVISLSHTLFYLQNYANINKPQLLKIGASWGMVNDYVSPIPYFIVDKFVTLDFEDKEISSYRVGFDESMSNTFYIQENMPFPIQSTLYDSKSPNIVPRILYQVKLLSISNLQKNSSQSYDKQTTPSSTLDESNTTQSIMNQTNSLKSENEFNFGDLNYTRKINSTSEYQVLKALKRLNDNYTLNDTR